MPPVSPPAPPPFPEVVRARHRLLAIVVGFGGPLFLVLLVIAAAPLWQRRWVEPIPGVRLEPSRPMLDVNDIKPDSAFDLLRRACVLEKKLEKPEDFNVETNRVMLDPWSEKGFPSLARMLEASAEARALARRALAAPDPQMPTYTDPGADTSYLTPVLDFTRLFDTTAAAAYARHDYNAATADWLDAMRIGDLVTRGSPLLHRLVDIASTRYGCTQVRCFALRERLPEENARTLIKGLLRLERELEPWPEGFREETVALPRSVALWYDPKAPAISAARDDADWEKRARRAARYLGPLVGSTPEETLRNLRAKYTLLIRHAELPYNVTDTAALRKQLERPHEPLVWLTTRDPWGRVLATLDFVDFAEITTRHYLRLADLRATAAVLAIRDFDRANGHPPAALSELVPDWLPAVPRDPFRDGPFRYHAKADGSWLLYSVGPDQHDDHGAIQAFKPRRSIDRGDLTYPSTELDDARARAIKLNENGAVH